MSKPIHGVFFKTAPHVSPLQLSFENFIGVCQDHYSKCDVNILGILCIQDLSTRSSILPESISFRFGRMKCYPLDAAIVRRLQGHSFGIEPHFLYCFHLALLSLCSKFPIPRNGGVTNNTALPNISIATTIWLLQVHHIYVLLEIDQVATSQHHFCQYALLPMYNLLQFFE
jgi:hypothetical protein